MDKLDFQPQLRRSHLVQRLEKPRGGSGPLADLVNAFSFGGGLRDGGIPKEGMALIKEIFSFDYMGAAEFEWGIVPSCLAFLVENIKDCVTGSIVVEKDKPTVYYLCHKDHADQVPDRIKLLATNPPRAKEWVGLVNHFEQPKRYESRAVGWLDCSNGFMFFVDEDMFKKTCQLFGVAQ